MSATIDEQFIEYIVKSLVGKPDAVSIARSVDEKGVLLELTVDPEDLGRVIGKKGATAQSMRTLLRALGTKNEARYNLKIVDNGAPKPDRQPYNGGGGAVSEGSWTSSAAPTQSVQDEPAADAPDAEPMSSDEAPVDTPAATEPASAEPAERPAFADDEPKAEPEPTEEEHQSDLEKTRKELDDLDDLDI